MIDAHLSRQSTYPRDVYIKFTLSGDQPDPDGQSYDCRHYAVFGPYSILMFDGATLMFTTADIAFDAQADAFIGDSVAPLRWIDPTRGVKVFENYNEKPAILDAMRTFTGERLLGMGSSHSNLLAKALMAGATLTPFQDQSPTARLFGGPATVGHVLTLPDTHRKHVLNNTDPATDLPILTDDARMDIDRFLVKK